MEQLKNLLKDLIRVDSSTKSGANEAIDYCKKWLSGQGLEAQEIENNGYRMVVCSIGKGEKTFIWNGHVDVVSGKEAQFTPYEEDGKLYGRGAADMKAGVAALMCALVELKDKDLNCKIQLQLVPDEEVGGADGSSHLAESGYRGDFVICPEPTQLGIGLQAKGFLRFDIIVRGESAHGSRPWEGTNAIAKAYGIYQRILDLPFMSESSEFYQAPSINLGKIQGGDAYNKVPDECIMSIDIRFLPTQNKEEVIRQIKSVTEGQLTIHLSEPAVQNKKEDPYIQDLISVVKKVSGRNIKVFGQHGSADTRYFAKFGIAAIEFGPCGENWHGNEEFIVLESVESYQKVLVDWVLMQSNKS